MSREDLVVCPKPRRVGLLSNNIIRPLRFHMRYTQKASSSSFSDSLLIITNFVLVSLFSSQTATDLCDSKAGAELLDIIRRKV